MQYFINIFLLIVLYVLKTIKYIFAFLLQTKHMIIHFTLNISKRKQK